MSTQTVRALGAASDAHTAIQQVAIIGAGPAGLIAYAALRYCGLPKDAITVYDDHPAPLGAWECNTLAIQQESMRSESEGHFFPTDFPGFAFMDALHRRSLVPLLRSVVNRYNPSLANVLRHGQALAGHFEMRTRIETARIARIVREQNPAPHFAIYDQGGTPLGRARHVLLALGHGNWRWPDACDDATTRARLEGILYHAYQSKSYDCRSALVIGSGMAAAGEWANLLHNGARVVALRRRQDLVEQPLSAPRCAFAGPWLDRYHALDAEARAQVLAELNRGTFPRPRANKALFDQAITTNRLHMQVGNVVQIEPHGEREAVVTVRDAESGDLTTEHVDMVIAATGFANTWRAHGILRQLVTDYHLQTHGDRLVLADDCTIPGISGVDSAIAVSGPLAAWAYPPADSFAGMKYAARRFTKRALPGQGLGVDRFPSWWKMVHGAWPYAKTRDESSASE